MLFGHVPSRLLKTTVPLSRGALTSVLKRLSHWIFPASSSSEARTFEEKYGTINLATFKQKAGRMPGENFQLIVLANRRYSNNFKNLNMNLAKRESQYRIL